MVKERPISIITGKPSQRGKRLKSQDGLNFRQRNRDAVNARKRKLYAVNPHNGRVRSTRYRKENPEKVRELNRQWRSSFWPALRNEMMDEYGGQCICCGEDQKAFLELDHIYNDGAEQRRKHRNSQQELLALKRAGWPKDRHQLLCANCNRGKLRNGGICPHAKNLS